MSQQSSCGIKHNPFFVCCVVIQADIAEEAARICKANPGAQTRHIQKPDWNGKRASTSIDSVSGSDTGYLQVIVQ